MPSKTRHIFFWGLSSSAHLRWLHYRFRDNHIAPISQTNWVLQVHDKLARIPQNHKTHKNTYICTWTFLPFMMQTGAEITGSCGSVWEYTPQRWSYTDQWGGRPGTHTHIQKNTLNLVQIQIWALSKCSESKQRHANKLTITHSHTLLCTPSNNYTFTNTRLAFCLQRLVVVSLWPAPPRLPPLAPKRERGLTAGPRHSLGCFCVDGAERGGIMLFHVSEHRHDAMYLSREILKCSRNKQNPTKRNKGENRTMMEAKERVHPYKFTNF